MTEGIQRALTYRTVEPEAMVATALTAAPAVDFRDV